jgi:hypothetical protein
MSGPTCRLDGESRVEHRFTPLAPTGGASVKARTAALVVVATVVPFAFWADLTSAVGLFTGPRSAGRGARCT